jgi:hypothetical protein
MISTKLLLSRASFCAVCSLTLGGAGAQSGGSTVDCIPVQRVDRTEVLDDRNIVFHMRGREAFLNRLEQDCPGLDREKRFMYEVRNTQLCSVDTISVLEDWGVGVASGFTCPLGPFQEMSEDELADLRAQTQRLSDDDRPRRARQQR